jgi:hypothetical protein
MTTPLTVSHLEPIKVMADIIQIELNLESGDVIVYNQRFKIPSTEKMFVVLSLLNSKIIGNNNYYEDDEDDGFQEIQEVAVHELLQIDIMSANDEARIRKHEVALALASVYAQQKCDENMIQIARIPEGFTDVSDLEAAARLNRYTATIAVKALYRKVKTVDYYGTFQNPEVHSNE